MPIAQRTEPSAPSIGVIPSVAPKGVKTPLVDLKIQPLHTLAAFMDGAPWTIKRYWRAVLSEASELKEIDTTTHDSYQQYECINNFEFRVQNALSASHDSETQISQVQGSSVMPGVFIPNRMDYFEASSVDGRSALFCLSDVERMTAYAATAYTLTYYMVGYCDSEGPRLDALVRRTIRTLFFDRARFVQGHGPLLAQNAVSQLKDLETELALIVKNYCRLFYNQEYATMVVPGQDHRIYDPYLVNFFLNLVDTDQAWEVQYIRQLPQNRDPAYRQPTVWDALLNRDKNTVDLLCAKMIALPVRGFNSRSQGRDAAFTGMDYYIYPAQADRSTLSKSSNQPRVGVAETLVLKPTESLQGFTYTDVGPVVSDIDGFSGYAHYTTLMDEYYVLSANFYLRTSQVSLIEKLCWQYLNKEVMSLPQLLYLCQSWSRWSRLDQFYLGPILIVLIRQALCDTYTS